MHDLKETTIGRVQALILTQLLKQRLDPKAFSNILAAACRSATAAAHAAPVAPPLPESGQAATEAPPGDTSSHRPLHCPFAARSTSSF